MLARYLPHDYGVVNCSLHFGQHHVLVIVTKLLDVSQHQFRPKETQDFHPTHVKSTNNLLSVSTYSSCDTLGMLLLGSRTRALALRRLDTRVRVDSWLLLLPPATCHV